MRLVGRRRGLDPDPDPVLAMGLVSLGAGAGAGEGSSTGGAAELISSRSCSRSSHPRVDSSGGSTLVIGRGPGPPAAPGGRRTGW
jgi:hypothetical protein